MDKDYIQTIETLFKNCKSRYDSICNKALAWDALKCEIRGITIEYSIKKARSRKQYVKDLNEEMKRLENKLDKEDVKETYDTIKNELGQIEEEKLRGNIIRSKAQWIEEGEKCSKYFMQLENRNYRAKCITSLKKEEKIITEQKAILEECKQFYKSLYSDPATEKDFENCKF